MVKTLGLLLFFFGTGINAVFSQNVAYNSTIVRDEKLFKEKSSGYSLVPIIKDSRSISNNINHYVTIKNDSLKFSLSYMGGMSGDVIIKLVTDGIIYQDEKGGFYKVKLYFIENDPGQVPQIKNLNFDLSPLNKLNVKFEGYRERIKYNFN